MIHSPKGFCPRVPYAKQDSGRVQYWVIWSLGQRNKFISHPTTAIRQLTFGHKACPTNSRLPQILRTRSHRPLVDDHPVDAEPIAQLTETGGEERLLHRHENFAAVRERRK